MGVFIQKGVTTEIIMLVISVLSLGLIIASRPKKTTMLKICYAGFALSIVSILSNMALFVMTYSMNYWNQVAFDILYIVFILTYTTILILIYTYVDFLSYTRRFQGKYVKKMLAVYAVIYFCIMLYPLVSGRLLNIGADYVNITHYYNAYVVCGIIECALCILTVVINRKTISPIVYFCCTIFIIADALILVAQLFCDTAVFTSATYVLVFLVAYILFHCNHFDEVSGAQNADSLCVRLDEAINRKKRFINITIIFPSLEKRDFYHNQDLMDYCASFMCRELERTHLGVKIYCHNDYTYSVFCEETKSDTAEKLVRVCNEILSTPIMFNNARVNTHYKMIIVHDSPRFSEASNIMSVIGFECRRFMPNLENEIIEVDDDELVRVAEYDVIEQELLDIRNKLDVFDERVLCYAQPIYCIETGTFRTAEALMRLKLNGRFITPDKFIPMAEQNGCIHSLTLIMMDKVCKYIKSIENQYDFDAITVNCSTVELDDRNLHREIADIINKNQVDPRKIRIEITESLDVSRYDNVLYNMQQLKAMGVEFYLDDFGTGYANLERIVSYPFHTIKFDKNILYRALDDQKADSVLDSTVALFQETGFNTVVEGVETEEQTQYAKEKGFGYIQGFVYSKPIEIHELGRFFEQKSINE